VRRTDKVSAAFIKELMRRSVQFHLERNGDGCVLLADVENALDEMLFSGGSLNLKLLGAEGTEPVDGAHLEVMSSG
jgi:cell division protease FtsH